MRTGKKILLIALLGGVVASLLWVRHVKRQTIRLAGAVITRSADPRKELPIAGVKITAADGSTMLQSVSDSSGLFTIRLHRRLLQGRRMVDLHFRRDDYKPLDLNVAVSGELVVAALDPVPQKVMLPSGPEHTIGNVVVRYSIKSATELDVGSTVRSFEVPNEGNVRCNDQEDQCSPDGKWRAATGSITLDAGPQNEFRSARASCIAGPCPFTRIDTSGLDHPGRTAVVSATTWSDTATFLVEAEVVHPMVSDLVRNSYPVIFGDALNFTLPPSAEGVTLQADLDGQTIYFPLGPALALDWGHCNARSNPDQTRVYRCELKPGYKWAKSQT